MGLSSPPSFPTKEDRRVDSASSSLDHQLAAIESILASPKLAPLLSDVQSSAISSLRKTICQVTATSRTHERVASILPVELLRKATSDESVSSVDVIAEFGGVDICGQKMRKTARMVRNANEFIRRTSSAADKTLAISVKRLSAALSLEDEVRFAPPEWKNLNPATRRRLRESLSWESLKTWGFNVLGLKALCGDGSLLLLVGWAILASPHSQLVMAESAGTGVNGGGTVDSCDGYNFTSKFNLSPEVLCGFLRAVESGYNKSNPYHNNAHAADVLQATHALLQMGGDRYASSPLDIFAILLAAVVHDIAHPGRNNAFQVNARTDIALVYNDNSVLENMHAAKAFCLLLGEGRQAETDVLGGLEPNDVTYVRTKMVRAVLGTDMSRHFSHMNTVKGYLESIGDGITDNIVGNFLSQDEGEPAADMLRFILHLADISNPTRPDPCFVQWADRALEEFFAQGDAEAKMGLPISPMCDRHSTNRSDSQIGFITYVVSPAFKLLEDLIPQAADEILPLIDANLKYWQQNESSDDRK